jgi:drug/metabolite transporter (DMT)-like permease
MPLCMTALRPARLSERPGSGTAGIMSTPKPALPGPIIAVLWMMGTLASFLLMAVAAKELSLGGLNAFQILFWRSFVGLVIVSVLLTRSGWHLAVTRQPGVQMFRNVLHFGAQFGWVYGIAVLSIPEVFSIEFSVPIWTAILATLFIGERLTTSRIIAIALGFIGVLIILRPGIAEVQLAHFAVLGAAVGFASAYVFTKVLTRTDAPITIIFYMTAIQLPIGLATSIDGWVWPVGIDWIWVLFVGVCGLSAHYCFTSALLVADATIVVPMDFMRLPLSAIVTFFVYGKSISIWVFIGAVVIFAGVFANVRAESRRTPPKVDDAEAIPPLER